MRPARRTAQNVRQLVLKRTVQCSHLVMPSFLPHPLPQRNSKTNFFLQVRAPMLVRNFFGVSMPASAA
jgi:hypothetical protein